MSVITEAIFFFQSAKVVKQMTASEFDALLDGIVQLPELASKNIEAVHLQINDHLQIQSLIFFKLGFAADGYVESDWNVPLNQLVQSGGRGPDLGAGVIRLVTQDNCTVPWHSQNLYNPDASIYNVLVTAVRDNKLGIAEHDDTWSTPAIPTLSTSVPTLEPVGAADIPVLTPAGAPSEVDEVPVLSPVDSNAFDEEEDFAALQQAHTAMKHALTIKLNRLQKEHDQLLEKSRSQLNEVKLQAKQHLEGLLKDSKEELIKKDQQMLSLKQQLQHEQKRYSELKEREVEQVAQYQADREQMLDQLEEGQSVETQKIQALKDAFTKELDARIDAESAKLNEQLALREVELFYREEQMSILSDEVKKLKEEKQVLLTESGKQVLKQLEDNGVTFVVYHVGVGHITLALEDVGRYLDERNAYLAERCDISTEEFIAWNEHFAKPVCTHVDESGQLCGKAVAREEWAASFKRGVSDCCDMHRL